MSYDPIEINIIELPGYRYAVSLNPAFAGFVVEQHGSTEEWMTRDELTVTEEAAWETVLRRVNRVHLRALQRDNPAGDVRETYMANQH